jgi:hypothetical protein
MNPELLREIAQNVLDTNPDPAVRVRLLRDVLNVSPENHKLIRAKNDLEKSRWVAMLRDEQKRDGSWGRFHSEDTKRKQRIPTTEFGVERALALGLDASHPLLENAIRYLVGLLKGTIEFPDPPEKNDRWETGKRLFVASTLARIQPDHPALNETVELWATIAEKTFASGAYDPDAEIEAHRQLTGATVKGSYLRLRGKYQLVLLGCCPDVLFQQTEKNVVNWLRQNKDGIGYLDMPTSRPSLKYTPSQMERWFTSMEIISRFSSWQIWTGEIEQWMLADHNRPTMWDFGPRASRSSFLPLSENWKSNLARVNDWATRTLLLMEQFERLKATTP